MQSTKLNLDELYEQKKERATNMVITFNRVLDRIHAKIKISARQKTSLDSCWFVMPELIFGLPRYDITECLQYCIQELNSNGFRVQYYHPNLLFITWGHWVPDYVRHEYSKHTGVQIDGFGKEIKPIEKQVKKEITHKPTSDYKPEGLIYQDEFIKLI
jgi:hypothetical protein